MLRVVSLTLVTLISAVAVAAAEPQAGDDLAICRDRQAELQARAQACDNLLNADRLAGKDKAIALSVRGNTLINKRDYARAIETLSMAVDLDPDNVIVLNLRGLAYERSGKDDHRDGGLQPRAPEAPDLRRPLQQPRRHPSAQGRAAKRARRPCRSSTRQNSCSAGPIAPACAR